MQIMANTQNKNNKYVIVGLVGGDSLLDKTIEDLSDAEYSDVSHAFMLVLHSTLESRGLKDEEDLYPGVWLHDIEKYRYDKHAKFFKIFIPDYKQLEKKAREELGNFYGYSSCIQFTIKKIFGKILFDINLKNSGDCSETVSEILRAGGIKNLYPDIKSNLITPEMLYQYFIDNNIENVTEKVRNGVFLK